MAEETAEDTLARARRREDVRTAATVRVDYDALNKMVKRQRAALTRAKNSGDKNKVIVACREAVREWNKPGAMWPDDWSHWQRTLDDVLGWNQQVDIADLA